MKTVPRVTMIIPTYNEENDIRRTLDAVVAIRYPDKEVLVIDDSTDATPTIAKSYAHAGVKVINGRSRVDRRAANTAGARNVGIREATGDILVFFNADNRPAPDYLERVMPHYDRGADYVFGITEVLNQDSIFGRYIGAGSHHAYDEQEWIEWEDGFSCRRHAAIAVGMFPELPVPMAAAEDGVFGFRLGQRFKKVIDRSIVVFHVAPSAFWDYWDMRKARGRATPVFKFFIAGQSLPVVFTRVFKGALFFSAQILLVVPLLVRGWNVASKSPRGRADTIPFAYAYAIELIARMAGECAGFFDLATTRDANRGLQEEYVDRDTARYFATAGKWHKQQ